MPPSPPPSSSPPAPPRPQILPPQSHLNSPKSSPCSKKCARRPARPPRQQNQQTTGPRLHVLRRPRRALSHTSTNPKYAQACYDIAERNQWKIHANKGPRRFFADDQAIGQLYIDLAETSHNLELLKPLIAEETALLGQLQNFDPLVSNPRHNDKPEITKMEPIPWWWCDSLFMNPPVLAGLSKVTADSKFIDAMDKAYWQTAALLYDPDEHLFYRDNRFLSMKSKNGKKVFWSRGDGWVMGGLTNILSFMPDNYPSRPKYEQLFKDMAGKILTLQEDNGLWASSLLDPDDGNPKIETSGSAFFTYAFAAGASTTTSSTKTNSSPPPKKAGTPSPPDSAPTASSASSNPSASNPTAPKPSPSTTPSTTATAPSSSPAAKSSN